MYTIHRILFLITGSFLLLSCIKEDYRECAVYLEFIFEHNMDYTDLFEQEVDVVDVYVFDADGYYLFNKHAECATGLKGGKQMELSEHFSPGKYQLLTVGGLTNHFRFSDLNDQPFKPGFTTFKDAKLSLYSETNEMQDEFPHLWLGELTQIEYSAHISVWPVYLIRETNHFNITLQSADGNGRQPDGRNSLYNFAIITPEYGTYGYDNSLLIKEMLTYYPYFLTAGSKPGILSEGNVKTMRLLEKEKDGYQLVVRRINTGEELLSHNLLELLEETKPANRPDGTYLPFQEYLDREGEWDIVIKVKEEPDPGDGFVAVSIMINGWIVWTNTIGV